MAPDASEMMMTVVVASAFRWTLLRAEISHPWDRCCARFWVTFVVVGFDLLGTAAVVVWRLLCLLVLRDNYRRKETVLLLLFCYCCLFYY
jgi:hypothetical protein